MDKNTPDENAAVNHGLPPIVPIPRNSRAESIRGDITLSANYQRLVDIVETGWGIRWSNGWVLGGGKPKLFPYQEGKGKMLPTIVRRLGGSKWMDVRLVSLVEIRQWLASSKPNFEVVAFFPVLVTSTVEFAALDVPLPDGLRYTRYGFYGWSVEGQLKPYAPGQVTTTNAERHAEAEDKAMREMLMTVNEIKNMLPENRNNQPKPGPAPPWPTPKTKLINTLKERECKMSSLMNNTMTIEVDEMYSNHGGIKVSSVLEMTTEEDDSHVTLKISMKKEDNGVVGVAEFYGNRQEIIAALEQLPIAPSTMRLIACDMVRHTPLSDGRTAWDLLTDERSRHAIEVAERHAIGAATDEELAVARAAAADAARAAQCDLIRARFTWEEVQTLIEGAKP